MLLNTSVSIYVLYGFFLLIKIKIIQSRKVITNIFSKKRQMILTIKLEKKYTLFIVVYNEPDIQKRIEKIFSGMNYKQNQG